MCYSKIDDNYRKKMDRSTPEKAQALENDANRRAGASDYATGKRPVVVEENGSPRTLEFHGAKVVPNK